MKSKLLALIIAVTAFLANTLTAQTISAIKSDKTEIKGRMSNSFYKHDNNQFKEIRNILNENVFEYFNLKKEYDTELKQKVFKDSEEYKSKLAELQMLKKQLLNTTYYLDFEPTYYERNNLIKYNLTTKTFSVSNEIYTTTNYNKPNFIQFDQIVLKNPLGLSTTQKTFSSGGVDFVRQNLLFKVDNEGLALNIEGNRSNLRILYLINFTQTSPFKNDVLGITTFTDYHLLTKVLKVYVYNSSTGEIYIEY
jgi:hypothetical protein